MLEKIHREYIDDPVQVISIHHKLDLGLGIFKTHLSSMQKIAERVRVSFPMLYDTTEANIAGRAAVRHNPTTLIVDMEGKIQYQEIGYDPIHSLPHIREIIERLMAG